jgi:hypothetical protein
LLGRALAHPLLLLLVGAVISTLVVPMLTQRWQNHQRALDEQTTLVADMTANSEKFIQALFGDEAVFAQESGRPYNDAQADLNGAVKVWVVQQAVIGSRLRAYYRGTPIPAGWKRLHDELEDLYYASGWTHRFTKPAEIRTQRQQTAQLSNRLANDLHAKVDVATQEGFARALVQVKNYRDELIQRVLDTNPRI